MGIEIASGDESGFAMDTRGYTHLLKVSEGKVSVVHTLRQNKIRLKELCLSFRQHWTIQLLEAFSDVRELINYIQFLPSNQ